MNLSESDDKIKAGDLVYWCLDPYDEPTAWIGPLLVSLKKIEPNDGPYNVQLFCPKSNEFFWAHLSEVVGIADFDHKILLDKLVKAYF